MTDYNTQVSLGTTISSLTSKDKGDFSNRVECAGAQIKNNLKTLAADTVVIGGVVAGTQAARKSGTFAKIMSKPIDWIAQGLSKLKSSKYVRDEKAFAKATKGMKKETIEALKLKNMTTIIKNGKAIKVGKMVDTPTVFTRAANFLKNMKTSHKAIAVVGAIGSAILARIAQKHFYQAGQIDQKYTDKAKLKARATEVV